MPDPPPAPSASDLKDHLGYWLRALSNRVSHSFQLKVESHGVTVAEWVILRALLADESLSASSLADTLGLTRGAVSKLIDRLSAKRLLTARVVRQDRRYQHLRLTPAGRALVPILAGLADVNDHEFFGHMSAQARSELKAQLEDLCRRHDVHQSPVD